MKTNTIINKATKILNENNNRNIIFEFLEKYIVCEVLCKFIIKKYLIDIGEEFEEDIIPFSLNDIKHAFSLYKIKFNNTKLLYQMWSKENKKGERSIRVLRNKIIHELNESCLIEVIEKKEILNNEIDIFINKIKNINI